MIKFRIGKAKFTDFAWYADIPESEKCPEE